MIAKAGIVVAAVAFIATPVAQATGLVIDTAGLTIAPTGRLNLKDNGLIVRNVSPAQNTTINGYLSLGLNLAGAAPGGANAWWDGYGIQSTVAAPEGNAGTGTLLHGVGGTLNSLDISLGGGTLTPTFYGKTVAVTDFLATYTCMGDADLDGFVTALDQFLLDNGIAQNLTGWVNGDFDYDGALTAIDQFLLDNSIGQGCVPPPAPPLGAAAVPEPGSITLLMAGMAAFIGRRNNRNISKK